MRSASPGGPLPLSVAPVPATDRHTTGGIYGPRHDHSSMDDGDDGATTVTPMAAAPDADRDVPAAVVERLDDASVVGLGVATHGTRECFAACDRLLRALVERGDVRTLAVETCPAGALTLDDYVARDEGTATDALAALDDWKWSTEAVADALAWLRGFNEGRPRDDRVRIRGVDVLSPATGADRLLAELSAVDPTTADAVRAELTKLADGVRETDVDAIERASVEAAAAVAATVRDRLDADAEGADRVRELCRAIERSGEWYDAVVDLPERPHPDGMAVRDRVMAENARERTAAGAVALWAHSGHVQRGTFDDDTVWADAETTGQRLAEHLGEDYCTVGTDFVRGGVRALERGADREPAHRAFELDDLPTATLAGGVDPGDGAAFVDLGDAPAERAVRTRYVGSVYNPDADPGTYVLETDASAFDGVVRLGDARASRLVD